MKVGPKTPMNIPDATRHLLQMANCALTENNDPDEVISISSSPSIKSEPSDEEAEWSQQVLDVLNKAPSAWLAPKPRTLSDVRNIPPPPPPPRGLKKRKLNTQGDFEVAKENQDPQENEIEESDRYLLEHAPAKIKAYKYWKTRVEKDISVIFKRWKSMKHLTTKQFIETASEYSNQCHQEWLNYDWKEQANNHFIKTKALEALKLKIEKWETLAEPCVNMTTDQLDAKANRLDVVNTKLAVLEKDFPDIMKIVSDQEAQVNFKLINKPDLTVTFRTCDHKPLNYKITTVQKHPLPHTPSNNPV